MTIGGEGDFVRRTLTTRIHSPYDRCDASPREFAMIHLSNTAVRRAVSTHAYHAWVLGIMTTLCLLMLPSSSRASGCHTPDRPVIASTFAWETDQNIVQATTSIIRPPAVLTHPHCGDEIPLASNSTQLPAVAILLNDSSFTSPDFREPLIVDSGSEHSQPPAVRLDRPPRSSAVLS